MSIQRRIAKMLQTAVVASLVVGAGAFALGSLGYVEAWTVTLIAFVAATAGALTAFVLVLMSDYPIKNRLP